MKLEKQIALKYPVLGSVADVERVALSLKGTALLLVPVLVQVLKLSGLDVLESDLVGLIEALFGLVGSGLLVFGLARKLFYKLKG